MEVLKLLNYGLNLRHFREQEDQERLTGEAGMGRNGERRISGEGESEKEETENNKRHKEIK